MIPNLSLWKGSGSLHMGGIAGHQPQEFCMGGSNRFCIAWVFGILVGWDTLSESPPRMRPSKRGI